MVGGSDPSIQLTFLFISERESSPDAEKGFIRISMCQLLPQYIDADRFLLGEHHKKL